MLPLKFAQEEAGLHDAPLSVVKQLAVEIHFVSCWM